MELNTEHLSFRVSPPLAAALAEQAERAGCSVSEYLRSIARERVGLQGPAPTPPADGLLNPYLHLRAAAAGDVEAMRLLANEAAAIAAKELDDWAMIEALVFARLAYARTGGTAEAGLVVGLLGLACQMVGEGGPMRDEWEAEALALISILADQGVDAADEALPSAMGECSPAAASLVKTIRKLMTEGTA